MNLWGARPAQAVRRLAPANNPEANTQSKPPLRSEEVFHFRDLYQSKDTLVKTYGILANFHKEKLPNS